jgi:hypothetical protein
MDMDKHRIDRVLVSEIVMESNESDNAALDGD